MDMLILEMGNNSIQINVRNPLKRGKYASATMRLCARALQAVRDAIGRDVSWHDCLVPAMYYTVVKAVCIVSGKTDDSFQHPSNALKLGHHIKELANSKYILARINKNDADAEDASTFKELCVKSWKRDVSSLACATLNERTFNKVAELPEPGDLEKLSLYLQQQAGGISEISTKDQFRHAVEVAQARLLTYNKRRPGELEAAK